MSRTVAGTAGSGRRARERDAHRREILDAAERVFVRDGFEKATMEQIAREADFSVGALYNFFDNKEDLSVAVVRKILEDFHALFTVEVQRQPDAFEAIEALVRLRLQHVRKHGDFLRMLIESKAGGRQHPEASLPKCCAGLYDHYLGEVAGLFRRAIRAGQVRPADPLGLAICLEGAMNAYCAYWVRHDMREPVEREVKAVRRDFLQHLLTGWSPRAWGERKGARS